jgi:hypothetical protein
VVKPDQFAQVLCIGLAFADGTRRLQLSESALDRDSPSRERKLKRDARLLVKKTGAHFRNDVVNGIDGKQILFEVLRVTRSNCSNRSGNRSFGNFRTRASISSAGVCPFGQVFLQACENESEIRPKVRHQSASDENDWNWLNSACFLNISMILEMSWPAILSFSSAHSDSRAG